MAIWTKMTSAFKKPFTRKKRKNKAQEALEKSSKKRRISFLKGEIASLEREIGDLKRGVKLDKGFRERAITFDIRQKLIRARDLRYKVSLLQAELERCLAKTGPTAKGAPNVPSAEKAPSEMAEGARRVLSNAQFANRSQHMLCERAVTDLLSTSAYKRRAAIKLLGDLRLPACAPLIKAAMVFNDDVLHAKCLEALVELKAPGTVKELEAHIDAPSYRVRIAALRGLYNLLGPEADSVCLQCLADLSPEVRKTAITFLGLIQKVEIAPAIAILLRDENVDVRLTAAKVLGDINSEQTVYMLIRALEDREPAVRVAAKKALNQTFSGPIEIDTTEEMEVLVPKVEMLLEWWAEVRAKGGPWRTPAC